MSPCRDNHVFISNSIYLISNYHTSMTHTTAYLLHTNQIQIQANLTFTLLLTLKMTAAKAVETSVTSTNSLSQDYTNLDDQLPQTYHDSPRFKPFTTRLFGRLSKQLANDYIRFASKVRRTRQQLWFNHRCKDFGLVPAGLRIKSPLNTQEAIQIVNSTSRRLIRARINDCHRRLNYYKNQQQRRLDKLRQLVPTTMSTDLLSTIQTIADKRALKNETEYRTKHQQKLERLPRSRTRKRQKHDNN